MIGYLSGKVISSKPTVLLLDVNGVGYLINISINTFETISNKDIVSLHIYTHVKEDSITLYGFQNESEKEMFELLISITGIVPFYYSFAFPLSIVLGLISIIFPGGIGVREGAISLFLISNGISADVAVTISILARIWFLAGEFFAFFLALYFRKRS